MNIFTIKSPRICRGDEIVVISGKYKGKKGVVRCVFAKKDELAIEGGNLCKKAMKISHGNTENFVTRERPIRMSKVKVVKKAQNNFAKKNAKHSRNEG